MDSGAVVELHEQLYTAGSGRALVEIENLCKDSGLPVARELA